MNHTEYVPTAEGLSLSGRRVVPQVIAGYAGFVALGVLSRLAPPVFLVMVLAGIVLPVVAARRSGTTLGYTSRRLGPALLWALGIGVVMTGLTVVRYGWSSSPLLGVQLAIGMVLWPLVLSPFQENVFRGWMQPRLQHVLGGRVGLLVTAAAFALWHLAPPLSATGTSAISFGTPTALGMAFVLGLLTGLSRDVTNGMVAPWLGHALAGVALVAVGQMTFLQYQP